jgi:hypothetical protein
MLSETPHREGGRQLVPPLQCLVPSGVTRHWRHCEVTPLTRNRQTNAHRPAWSRPSGGYSRCLVSGCCPLSAAAPVMDTLTEMRSKQAVFAVAMPAQDK